MPKTYSIGFLCSSESWGGLEMNVLRLAVWLRQRDWDVVLYGNPDTVLFKNAERNGVRGRRLVSNFKYGDIVNARRLGRRVRQDNVRRLIINYGKDLLVTVLAKIITRDSFELIMLQHMHVGGHKQDLFHTWEYRHLDAWIAPLPMFADRIAHNTRIDPEKIHVVPFGIDLERFTSGRPDKRTARERLSVSENALVAGIVGRLDQKKGQDILIKACAKVHEAGIPLQLLVIGDKTTNDDGAYSEYLRNLTRELGLEQYVWFRPFLSDVECAYAALDILVMASHSETYGMVTIEGMASGLPVIGTAEGGTVEIINDCANGILVPSQDANKLAQAILRVVNDPELAHQLSQQAQSDAIANYSHVRQCELMESLFDSLGS